MTELVPIGSVKPHPRNPRRGNVTVIAESLRVNGQYLPILVHRPTKQIIAGNHTWKAAKSLGWSNILATWTDCSEAEALEIMVSDNHASDMGTLDQSAVFSLASSLPSLEGTGYCDADLKMPDLDLGAYDPVVEAEPADKDTPADRGLQPYLFRVGQVRGVIDRDTFDSWRAGLEKRNSAAVQQVLNLLGLVVPDEGAEERSAIAEPERVPINTLHPFPGNPNQGDLGLISTLLAQHGQTRPIVVSRRTNRILRGNHVTKAAEALGWTHVDVCFVDVDADGEKRIVLVDNRSSSLAQNSNEDLGSLLAGMGANSVLRSGLSLNDLDDILTGTGKPRAYTKSTAKLVMGPLKADISTELLADLNLTPGQELAEVAMMVNLDPQKVAQLPA